MSFLLLTTTYCLGLAIVAVIAYMMGRETGWDEGWDACLVHGSAGALDWLDPLATDLEPPRRRRG